MSASFLAGVTAGYGVALPMGAIGVLIAGLSARTSLRVGAAAGLGAATADGVFAAIAVAGGAAVAGVIAPITVPLRWAAAVVLLGIAVMTARAAFRKPTAVDQRPATPGRAYLGVLGLTLLNPATVVYFAALVLGRGGEGGGPLFVAGVFLASASWQLVIAGGGSLVGRWLTGPRGRLLTALLSSLVIAYLAVRLLLPS
ncbi:LysE family transporter [Actinoplanes bogorensis]|uniref:LysE family transporter n=1 Tax=Paractinoplanes bogorensis TaxID=1610840 RepID=A0ABS5YUS5_9ACTN|nr:LysE family transporter [Actinoplanes bogorensis]MBU2665835.1 LysE family transporter [Actinoplanes bogorensis]